MNNSTAEKTEPTTRTEWGIQRSWRDGHVEYKRSDDREDAERQVRIANDPIRRTADVRVVTRTVTTTPWQPVA